MNVSIEYDLHPYIGALWGHDLPMMICCDDVWYLIYPLACGKDVLLSK